MKEAEPRKELCVRGRRVVLPDRVGPAAIHIRDGVITRVADPDDVPQGVAIEDAGDLVVMPGLVDTHVHINDPGRADWEGFETATRAAAAGGITTLMDMPLNSLPPTTSQAAVLEKASAAAGRCHVDVALAGGVVPGNSAWLGHIQAEGVLAFKCFLCDSGVPEFPHVTEDTLRPAMAALARLGAPLLVHAELPAALREVPAMAPEEARRYLSYLRSRPHEAEDQAIEMVIRLARKYGTRVHIVHLSSADALGSVRRARDEGVAISVETCPHYLSFAAEEIADGRTEFKCAPPIREAGNRERLWGALREGTIDQIVTDHSPSTPSLKCQDSGDFMRAWGGISSLQLSLPVVWSEARARGFGLRDLAAWLCEGPARLVGLSRRKGSIATGHDADLVIWDPDATLEVEGRSLLHRHPLTPYEGRVLHGVVLSTFLRGERIHDRQRGSLVPAPRGVWLRRGA